MIISCPALKLNVYESSRWARDHIFVVIFGVFEKYENIKKKWIVREKVYVALNHIFC